MSAFFSNFFKGRFGVAFKSLWTPQDVLDIQGFERSMPFSCLIKCAPGVGRKPLVKGMRDVYASTVVSPADIAVLDSDQEKLTPSEFVDHLLEMDNFRLCYVGEKLADEVKEAFISEQAQPLNFRRDGKWVRIGNFLFIPRNDYNSVDPLTILVDQLRSSWLTVQTRTAKIPQECPQCSENLYVDEEDCCGNCGIDINLGKVPKTAVKFYKEITKYEKDTEKAVIERVVSEAA